MAEATKIKIDSLGLGTSPVRLDGRSSQKFTAIIKGRRLYLDVVPANIAEQKLYEDEQRCLGNGIQSNATELAPSICKQDEKPKNDRHIYVHRFKKRSIVN